MKEMRTSEYIALVSTPGMFLKDHSGYEGNVEFNPPLYRSSFYGFFIRRQPFIHFEDAELLNCTDLSIVDKKSGVYVASHLLTGNAESELRLLEKDMTRLDEVLSGLGSEVSGRELGMIFGCCKLESQHKNVFDLLVSLGYKPRWVYQCRNEDEMFLINHENGKKTAHMLGVETEIPDKIDQDALVNGNIMYNV